MENFEEIVKRARSGFHLREVYVKDVLYLLDYIWKKNFEAGIPQKDAEIERLKKDRDALLHEIADNGPNGRNYTNAAVKEFMKLTFISNGNEEYQYELQERVIQAEQERDEIVKQAIDLKARAIQAEQDRDALLEKLEGLGEKLADVSAFADTERLTFPLDNPTEDEQNEWFYDFVEAMGNHVRGVIDDFISDYDSSIIVKIEEKGC